MLYVIITVLGPVSGGHFNPAVTLAFALRRDIPAMQGAGYVLAQLLGGTIGVWASHLMFEQPVLQIATAMHRTGANMWLSELIATFGLLLTIFGGLRAHPQAVPTLVALYVTGAYWFTASSGFANPAVTIARGLTDSFAGINPGHIPAFVLMQILAVLLAHAVLRPLFRQPS
jgi:glycerol uptake facilitator-like aquaporin